MTQRVVRHAPPEEVGQPGRQRVVVQFARGASLVQEGRRAQNRPKRYPHDLYEWAPLRQWGLGEAGVGFQLSVVEGPAERPCREALDDVVEVFGRRLAELNVAVLVEVDPR